MDLKVMATVGGDGGEGVKQGEWLWSYFTNKNSADRKLTLSARFMGRGRRVGRGDLNEIDYWWRYWAENPMVMGLSSWRTWWYGEWGQCGREGDGGVM
jgi:hypothetical protein